MCPVMRWRHFVCVAHTVRLVCLWFEVCFLFALNSGSFVLLYYLKNKKKCVFKFSETLIVVCLGTHPPPSVEHIVAVCVWTLVPYSSINIKAVSIGTNYCSVWVVVVSSGLKNDREIWFESQVREQLVCLFVCLLFCFFANRCYGGMVLKKKTASHPKNLNLRCTSNVSQQAFLSLFSLSVVLLSSPFCV